MITFKNQFIVLDGTEENLNKAIDKAKELGYVKCSEGLEWSNCEINILKLDEDGEYFLTANSKEELLEFGYTELSLHNSPHYVYVSDNSVEDAVQRKEKGILLYDLGEQFKFRYVCVPVLQKQAYLNGEKVISGTFYRYIKEIPEEENKTTLTLQEIADKFGIDKSKLLIKE